MFGHQDDEQAEQASAATAPVAAHDHSQDANQSDGAGQDAGAVNNGDYLDHLAAESLGDAPQDSSAPASDDNNSSDSASADYGSDDNSSDDNATPLADDGLLEIKKQALGELSPLVDHLDQTPEEKFKTTMMMIQAADNQSLIPDAYHAAKEISDEKARAQALLDIVNEINYFTHKS